MSTFSGKRVDLRAFTVFNILQVDIKCAVGLRVIFICRCWAQTIITTTTMKGKNINVSSGKEQKKSHIHIFTGRKNGANEIAAEQSDYRLNFLKDIISMAHT